jgi:hypothetical protein
VWMDTARHEDVPGRAPKERAIRNAGESWLAEATACRRVHRGVDIGNVPYEEITVCLLDRLMASRAAQEGEADTQLWEGG